MANSIWLWLQPVLTVRSSTPHLLLSGSDSAIAAFAAVVAVATVAAFAAFATVAVDAAVALVLHNSMIICYIATVVGVRQPSAMTNLLHSFAQHPPP